MSPADAAAYAALEVQPGAAWPVVHEAWRRLMKRHHPDAGALTTFDERRVREANAAYAHLGRRQAAPVGPSVARSRWAAASRRAVWDVVWRPETWPAWLPGLRAAGAVRGASDRRIALAGRWGGHRVAAQLVVMTAAPPCRLSGRLLSLRVDGEPVPSVPPRVWVRIDEAGAGVRVELGLALPGGGTVAPVLVAALDAALLELIELA